MVPDSQAAADDHVVDEAHRSAVLGWELGCNCKQGWLRAGICDHTQIVSVTQLQQAKATAVVTAQNMSRALRIEYTLIHPIFLCGCGFTCISSSTAVLRTLVATMACAAVNPGHQCVVDVLNSVSRFFMTVCS